MTEELKTQIEGYLFYIGEPVEKTELESIFGINKETLAGTLKSIASTYSTGGIILVENETAVTFGVNPLVSKRIEEIRKDALDRDLTKAALETLSVILYHPNATRSDIDYVRGVNSQFSIRTLLIRGLIEKIQHPTDNRKFVYIPTIAMYEFLGVKNRDELPQIEEIEGKVRSILENKPTESAQTLESQ